MNDELLSSADSLRLSLRVFALFAAIYLCTWAGHYTSGDGSLKIAWAKALLQGQVFDAGPSPGKVYSKYGIGHSLLAVPPLALADLIQKVTRIRCEPALYTLMFVVNGALFLALVAFYLSRFYSSRSVWLTVAIIGLATIWWPYTKLDFSEPFVLTFAFLGFVLIRFGRPAWGILVAGFTLAIRSDSVAMIGPLLIWYLLSTRSGRDRMRASFRIAVSLAPSIALVLFANYIRYHSLMDRGYAGESFSNPLLIGVYGILFSSGKSILLFSPPLLLGILGWKRFALRNVSDAWLFLTIGIAQVLLFAKWWDWSSDDAWGVRFLIPGVLLMCIPLVEMLERRSVVVLVAALGVLVQLLAVSAGGLDYLMLIRSQPFERQALYVNGKNRIDFEDLRFDPSYSQIVGNWILLRYLLHIPPAANPPENAQTVGTRLEDTIPPRVWAEAAKWDLVWNLRRSAKRRDANPESPVEAAPTR
jgi:hypothetical protein